LKTQKSNTFFGGAAILAAGIVVVKLIGALYKIPLGRILGDLGFAYFNNAYAVFNLLLMVSTAGLPVAISKTISEAHTLGRRNQVNRIFKVALITFLVLGTISALIMLVFAEELATFQGQRMAAPAVRVMALSAFFLCTMSAYRGYAQGHSDMVPTAISQIIEAVSKLGIGLALALYLKQMGFGEEITAAGGIAGVTCGGFLALLYLMAQHHRNNRRIPPTTDVPESGGRILKTLASIAVMAVVTFMTRALPFLLFDRGEHPPKLVLYLGRVLPPAIIAMLIVYCLKGVTFTSPAGWVPPLVAGLAAVLLHIWKGNDLLSIFGATILYMGLVQGVFG